MCVWASTTKEAKVANSYLALEAKIDIQVNFG